MLLAVLSVCSPEELEDGSSSEDEAAERTLIDQATTPDTRATRRQQIRNKILAVGRLQLMFQNLRYVTTPHRWTYTHVGHIQ
jgi:serine/threonine-protein phosphatase 2B catalytic subunit